MSTNPTESQGLNPAWKPLLDVLPDAMHSLVTPHLAAWDKGVQDKLQEVRGEYEPYKGLVSDKIDPELIKRSLYLYNEFANNPEEVITEAIKAYDLPYVDKSTIEATDTDEDFDFDMDNDITKHPQFKELMEQVQGLQGTVAERQQAEEMAQAVQNHQNWLNDMQKPEKFGAFDTEYVTALMSQGVDGEEAIKRYQEKFANVTAQQVTQTEDKETPPVVMGGNGNTGSGLPDNSINFSTMSKNDFEDTVFKMLQADQQNNNQG